MHRWRTRRCASGGARRISALPLSGLRRTLVAALLLLPNYGAANDDFDSDLDMLIEREAYYGNTHSEAPRTIELVINGVSGAKGKINVLVFNDAGAFARYDFLAAAGLAELDAVRGSTALEVTVKGTGPYAVFIHHDENNNKQVEQSNGKPLEGVGYSGWVEPYRAPSFDESAIVEALSDTPTRIRMTYYRKDLRLGR